MAAVQEAYTAWQGMVDLNVPFMLPEWGDFWKAFAAEGKPAPAGLALTAAALQDLDGHIGRMGLSNLRAKVGFGWRAIRWAGARLSLVINLVTVWAGTCVLAVFRGSTTGTYEYMKRFPIDSNSSAPSAVTFCFLEARRSLQPNGFSRLAGRTVVWRWGVRCPVVRHVRGGRNVPLHPSSNLGVERRAQPWLWGHRPADGLVSC